MTSRKSPTSVLEGTFGGTARDSCATGGGGVRARGGGGQAAAAGRLVTAVGFRESDCRLSSEDVTYPSAGILLLNFSRPRLRGEGRWGRWGKRVGKVRKRKWKKKNTTQEYLMRSFLKSIRRSSCQ